MIMITQFSLELVLHWLLNSWCWGMNFVLCIYSAFSYPVYLECKPSFGVKSQIRNCVSCIDFRSSSLLLRGLSWTLQPFDIAKARKSSFMMMIIINYKYIIYIDKCSGMPLCWERFLFKLFKSNMKSYNKTRNCWSRERSKGYDWSKKHIWMFAFHFSQSNANI